MTGDDSRTARRSTTDRALARRLERAEAAANAAFVEARARLQPAVGAGWIEVAGTYAMFDGIDSPLTQTFGLGLFHDLDETQLDAIERFFGERGAATHHEVSPIAGPAPLALLPPRGYVPIEQSTVLVRELTPSALTGLRLVEGIDVRVAPLSEAAAWGDLAARGWGEQPELAGFMRDFGAVTARAQGVLTFVARLDGADIATGALAIHDGVALLAGASTLPAARRRGAQAALLAARLHEAGRRGCDLAMMAAAPGSTSQCNAERQGFRIAYTRTKWRRGG